MFLIFLILWKFKRKVKNNSEYNNTKKISPNKFNDFEKIIIPKGININDFSHKITNILSKKFPLNIKNLLKNIKLLHLYNTLQKSKKQDVFSL